MPGRSLPSIFNSLCATLACGIGFATLSVPASALTPPMPQVILDVAVLPDKTLLLWKGNGLLRSADGGAHWQAAKVRFSEYRMVGDGEQFHATLTGSAALDPGRDIMPVLYGNRAVLGNRTYACHGKRTYFSGNAGLSWYAQPGSLGASCTGFAAIAGSLYRATMNGLYRADPPEFDWKAVPTFKERMVRRLFAGKSGAIYVGLNPDDKAGTAAASDDGGRHWRTIVFPPSMQPSRTYALFGIAGDMLFASDAENLISSTDGGVNWSNIDGSLQDRARLSGNAEFHSLRGFVDGGDGVQYVYTAVTLHTRVLPDEQWKAVSLEGTGIGKVAPYYTRPAP